MAWKVTKKDGEVNGFYMEIRVAAESQTQLYGYLMDLIRQMEDDVTGGFVSNCSGSGEFQIKEFEA